MSEHTEPYGFESIGDVLKRVATPEGQQAARDQERSFRRGYVDGYEAALDDLQAMIRAGVEPKMILSRMVTHSERDIAEWRRGVTRDNERPPRLAAAS